MSSSSLPTQALPKQIRRRQDGAWWRWASRILALLVLVPLLVIFSAWTAIDAGLWQHLAQNLLPELLLNTLLLVVGVGVGSIMLGVSLAWLTSMCEFPGRRWLDWALMLPFALPAYVLAFVFIGVFDFAGPVQSALREWFDLGPRWSIEIRNAFGVILVMTLVLYPYVYMLARVAFIGQGQSTYEAARGLGRGPWSAFFHVSLPMARPAIVAGVSLALMEALADFGAVSVFNFNTFTTAIYKAWFGFFDLNSAAQLASVLLVLVLLALWVERRFRARARYAEHNRGRRQARLVLRGSAAWLAASYAGGVFLLAFTLPVGQLLIWAWKSRGYLDQRYLDLFAHTFYLGAAASLFTLVGAFLFAFSNRYYQDGFTRVGVRIGTLGYALPGSVLAVGVMLSLTWFDNRLADLWQWLTGHDPGLFLAGTLWGLMFAYLARFLAVAYGPVDSALERIRPHLREAARSLGANHRQVLWRVYLPMLRPGLLTAALLVLVDVMKEMPATLLLRPFGWDTLAVRIYELTSEGEWERAALPAVALIITGLLPVLLLVRKSVR